MSDAVNSLSELETLQLAFKDNNFDIYALVWLDSRIDADEHSHVQESLNKLFIDHFQIFNECDPCEKYIQSTSTDIRIILIADQTLGKQIIPEIHQLRQVSDVYINCKNIGSDENWTKQYKKVSGKCYFK